MPFIRFENRAILFVRIPKTAGTSVARWPVQHGKLSLFRCKSDAARAQLHAAASALPGPEPDVRARVLRSRVHDLPSPFHRPSSANRMRMILRGQQLDHEAPPFARWLSEQLDAFQRNPFHLDNHVRPQWHFTSSRMETFHYEDGLEVIVARVAARAGLPPPEALPREMATDRFTGQIEWDQAVLPVQTVYR